MQKFRILVSDDIAQEGIDLLEADPQIDVDVRTKLPREELYAIVGDYDGLITRSMTTVDEALLSHVGDRLKVVGRAGVGLDNVDVEAASKRGIVVLNTPTGNTLAATEHSMAMMLAACRMLPTAQQTLKGGKWDRKRFVGFELARKTLGIIGLGRIGSQVARRARGFDMELLAYDPYIREEKARSLGVRLCGSLEELLRRVDVLTLHAPRTPETLGMIGADELAMLRPGGIVVNVARGGLIDEMALLEACRSGHVRAAAVDVFDVEPALDHPFFELDNIIVTPHLGANTDVSQVKVAEMVARQVSNVLKGEDYEGAVNIPAVLGQLEPEFRSYFELAEQMGRILGSRLRGGIEEVSLVYRGSLFDREFGPRSFDVPLNLMPFTVAALKGVLEPRLEKGVSYISAPYLMRERGVAMEESRVSAARDYQSLVELVVRTTEQTLAIAGTVFENQSPRVVRIDQFEVDFCPRAPMLIFTNHDQNGVIGAVASVLGNRGYNISDFALNRDSRTARAMGVVSLDQRLEAAALDEVAGIPGVLGVTAIQG